MNIKLLTEQHLEFLSLKGGCTGSSESVRVKMPHRWKSHVAANNNNNNNNNNPHWYPSRQLFLQL